MRNTTRRHVTGTATTHTFGFPALVLLAGILTVAPAALGAGMTDAVEQYGVRFVFDRPYMTGTFANGDYWVKTGEDGRVVITALTPAGDGEHHGWEVNPDHTGHQGFDKRIGGFRPDRVPALPYEASAGESIVKTVSVDPNQKRARPALKTAVVLTVLDDEPPNGGDTVFRPPYFGTKKPFYSVDDLRLEKLPAIDGSGVSNTPSLAWVEDNFRRVWLDHKFHWSGRNMHPKQNLPDYGSGIGRLSGMGALRLMLNDPVAAKRQAAINYVQVGLDLFQMWQGGLTWPAAGGHMNGRKLPITLAGVLLENEEMMRAVRGAGGNVFQEDGSVYYSPTAKMVLWGQPRGGERMYWLVLCEGRGSKNCRDPYRYIDGGVKPGYSYQACCNSRTWKATGLCLHLMPELRRVWNEEPFLDYLYRWIHFGAWTQPDPYALTCENPGAKDKNPEDGTGRFPDLHGVNADGGGWGSRFADAMWKKLRPGDAAGMPAIVPYGQEFTDSVRVTLESSPRTPGCDLRYTLDGSTPSADDALYREPLELTETTTVKVRATREGLYDSAVNTVTFTQTEGDGE